MFHIFVLFSLLCCLLSNLGFAQSLRGQSVRIDYNHASQDINVNSLKTAVSSSWEASSSPLIVPPGYWKLSTETVNPIKCPIAEACLGISVGFCLFLRNGGAFKCSYCLIIIAVISRSSYRNIYTLTVEA